MRVLLIAEDPDLCVARPYLKIHPGDEIRQVAPGSDCVEQVRAYHPDLVLVDEGDNACSGAELARAVHADLSLRQIPVMVVPGLESRPTEAAGAAGLPDPGQPAEPANRLSFGSPFGFQLEGQSLERQILDNIDQAVIVIGPGGEILYWNRYAGQLYGASAADALGRPADQVLGRRGHFYLEQVLPRVDAAGHWELEYMARHTGGRMLPILLTFDALRDEHGRLAAVLERASDISARKENENRYQRSLFDAPFPVMIHAEDGEILMINRAFTELSGYEPGHIPRIEDWLERAFGAQARLQQERINHLYHMEGRVEEGEYLVQTLKGGLRTWQFDSTPLGKTIDGRQIVMSMAVDITERKAAEDQLRRMIADAPYPISLYAEDGEMLMINRSWQEITGYSLQEIPTINDWVDRAYGERKDEVQRIIQQVSPIEGRIHVGELPIRNAGGGQRVWDFTTVGLGSLPDGRRFRMSVAVDVTERKDIEKRFERAIQEAPFPIIMYAADGEMLLINQAWSEVTGYDLQDIPNIQQWAELAFGARQEVYLERLRAAIPLDERTHLGHFLVNTKDGRQREWDFHSVSPGRLPDGRRIRLTIAADITELKAVQARFERAVTSAPFPMAIYTDDGEMLMLNDAWTHYSGYTLDDLPTNRDWVVRAFGEEAGLELLKAKNAGIFEGRSHHGEYRIRTREGQVRVWDFSSVLLGEMDDGRRYRLAMAADLTERKEYEDRFRLAVEHAPFPTGLYLEDGTFVMVNQALTDLTGYTLEDLPTLDDWIDLAFPGRTVEMREMIQHNMQSAQPINAGTMPIQTKDGRQRMWNISGEWVGRLADGQRLRMFMAVDLTERSALEQNFERAVLDAPLPMMLYSEGGQVLLVNHAWSACSGYELVDIPTVEAWMERAYGPHKDVVIRAMQTAHQTEGRTHPGEFEIRTRDGQARLWDFSSVWLGEQHDGKRLRLVMATDITENRRLLRRQVALAEIDMAISRPAELPSGLAQAVTVVCELLGAGIGAAVVLANGEKFKLAASSLVGCDQAPLERVLAQENGLSRYLLHKNVAWYVADLETDRYARRAFAGMPVSAYAAVPIPVDGEPGGLLYVLDDRPRQMHPDEQEFLSLLAQRLGLALARVALYERLRQARDAAEAAVRSKADFLANMSHELRTPLTTITTLAELMQDTRQDPIQANYTQSIAASAARLLELINRVLDFSRLEAHKLALVRQPVDLRRMIETVLDLVAVRGAQRGIAIEYLAGADVPYRIYSDAVQLGQVLTNLLSNALKFTDTGQVRLQVTRQAAQEQPGLLFVVQDTGPGIPPEGIEQLFQPFSQVDTSPTRRSSGSGLGLVISKQIVELMGGRIW
ncbi:MAG: PAS domain S-box protein, partial [Chloroflexota bacterium]